MDRNEEYIIGKCPYCEENLTEADIKAVWLHLNLYYTCKKCGKILSIIRD